MRISAPLILAEALWRRDRTAAGICASAMIAKVDDGEFFTFMFQLPLAGADVLPVLLSSADL